MNESASLINQIAMYITQKEYYVPRNYQTVGGVWTVDTYRKGTVTLQLMDEGWSTRIFNEDVSVTDRAGHIKFERGSLDDLKLLYQTLIKED